MARLSPPIEGGNVYQIGYQESPEKTMYVILDSKRDRELSAFPLSLLGPDFGYVRPAVPGPNDGANALDSFGNLEVSPPLVSGHPLGRIYFGDDDTLPESSRIDKELREFFERQAVQSRVTFDTDWLDVGHVDEFMSIVPNPAATNGWTVLLADPVLALDILQGNALVPGGVDAMLHIPDYDRDYGVRHVGALLGRSTSDGSASIETYNAAGGTVDAMLGTLKTAVSAAFGLQSSEDVLRVPVLFDAYSTTGKALAITPNLVNCAVYGSTVIAPDPFLHASTEEDANGNWRLDPAEDVNGNGMLDTLRDPFQAWLNANMPAGIAVQFIDDWFLYHAQDGEVHCSSNDKRTIPSAPKWWQNVP